MSSKRAPEDVKDEKRQARKKSRWSGAKEDKTVIPGMPTMLPPNMTPDQTEIYVMQLRIEDISQKLRTGNLAIPADPRDRSPSPEPVYSQQGQRLNTRETRVRKQLETERHTLVAEAMRRIPEFRPPADYKAPVIKYDDRVWIPQEDHPEINFVGLIIGPRGNTLKGLELELNCKIIIRGKGSVKEGKMRPGNMPLPGEDEDLHAFITANDPETLKRGTDKIREIIRNAIECPEEENTLRKKQLRELALLNGTLKDGEGLQKLREMAEADTIITNRIICTRCGGAGHIDRDCLQPRYGSVSNMDSHQPPVNRMKMDAEYSALMAELGQSGGQKLAIGGGSGGAFNVSSTRPGDPMKALEFRLSQNNRSPAAYGVQTSQGALQPWSTRANGPPPTGPPPSTAGYQPSRPTGPPPPMGPPPSTYQSANPSYPNNTSYQNAYSGASRPPLNSSPYSNGAPPRQSAPYGGTPAPTPPVGPPPGFGQPQYNSPPWQQQQPQQPIQQSYQQPQRAPWQQPPQQQQPQYGAPPQQWRPQGGYAQPPPTNTVPPPPPPSS